MPEVSVVEVDPRPVAFARIFIGLAAVMIVFEGHALMLGIADGKLAMPYASWLPGPADVPLAVVLLMALLAAVGLVAGCFAQVCAGILAFTQVLTLIVDEQSFSSHRVLLTLLLLHLMFARSDAVWSLKARYMGRRESVPLWPQVLMIGTLSSLYVFAGLSKVNPIFLAGDIMRDELIFSLSNWMYVVLAIGAVATELFIGVGLWFERTRRLAVAAGLVLHTSIVLFLGYPFVLVPFALLCVGTYWIALARPIVVADPRPDLVRPE